MGLRQVSLEGQENAPRHGPPDDVQFSPYDGAPRTGTGRVREHVEQSKREAARKEYEGRQQP